MPNLTIQTRHRVRKDVQDALTRNYWNSKGEAITAIDIALRKHNMKLDPMVTCSGDEGNTSFRILADPNYRYLCDACTKEHENPTFDNVVSFSWYKMQSGRWEIVAYIS